MSPLEAARTSMDEVATALVAIVLVLCAVFVPTCSSPAFRAVLQAVCRHHLDRDGHLAAAQPDAVACSAALLLRGHVDAAHAHCPAGGGCCKRVRTASTPASTG
jgi:hypothetical protein